MNLVAKQELLAEARERHDKGIESNGDDEPNQSPHGSLSSAEEPKATDGGEGENQMTATSASTEEGTAREQHKHEALNETSAPSAPSASLGEQVQEGVRVRELRKSTALEEMRKRTSSFTLPKVPSAKFTNVNDVTRGQVKSLARGSRMSDADVWRAEEVGV